MSLASSLVHAVQLILLRNCSDRKLLTCEATSHMIYSCGQN